MNPMNKKLALLLALTVLCSACSTGNDPASTDPQESATTATETVLQPAPALLNEDGTARYTIIRSDMAANDSAEVKAALALKNAIKDKTGVECKIATDWVSAGAENVENTDYEILVGSTNRKETAEFAETLDAQSYWITESGTKIVIVGGSERATQQAVNRFLADYVTNGDDRLSLPSDLHVTGQIDYRISAAHGMTYLEMGDIVLEAFVDEFYQRGILRDAHFWDTAEILEAFLDAAYTAQEHGDTEKFDKYLQYCKEIAKTQGARKTTSWKSNDYNDDIAWMCIAYTRLSNLCQDEEDRALYLGIAKSNFDMMYERALSDHLGGGLFWRTDNETKNSCINCPASIAACLIGKASGDESYFEKAKGLMDWEFANLFDKSTGAVWDSYNLKGEKNKWASTYNQGTFIGACTLLHEKYGDDVYMENAAKAASYAMNNLEMRDGVLNGENSGGDLIGFKGILVRWLHLYARYTQDMDALTWLQSNADEAFSNRNGAGLIWTTWADKTNNNIAGMDVFGFSPAIALLFHCDPWWVLAE